MNIRAANITQQGNRNMKDRFFSIYLIILCQFIINIWTFYQLGSGKKKELRSLNNRSIPATLGKSPLLEFYQPPLRLKQLKNH